MKLVFTCAEVAEALAQTEERFMALRPKLEALGFPKPVPGLDDCWSIMAIISWVNGEGSSMKAAHLLQDEEDTEETLGRH
jgi:hypothetical protein